jgi:hypothetical protein
MIDTAKIVASNPGPNPPYQALIMTATMNKEKTLGSMTRRKSHVNNAGTTMHPVPSHIRVNWI